MEELSCRIQYVNDADPFATTSSAFLEPMRPVTFNFRLHTPVGEQLAEVIQKLRAPHKVIFLGFFGPCRRLPCSRNSKNLGHNLAENGWHPRQNPRFECSFA